MKKILFILLIFPFLGYSQTNKFKWLEQTNWTASGTNTYTATVPSMTFYPTSLDILVRFTNANSGASTLNINSLGAVAIQKNGAALVSGDIPANSNMILSYDGASFQILGQGAGGGGGSSWLLASGGTLTGANTIVSTGANNVTFNQSALGAGNGMVINSTSTDATANTQTAFRVNQSGANSNASQTTYSGYFSNTKTGTTNTNVAGYFEASGGTTSNIAIQVGAGKINASSSATNAGINVGSFAGTPSTLSDGDLWYNSTTGNLGVRVNSSSVILNTIASGYNSSGIPYFTNASYAQFATTTGFGFTPTSGLVIPNRINITQAALSSSWVTAQTVTPGAHTALTASTAFPNQVFSSATQSWVAVAGTIAAQKDTEFRAITHSAATSGTFTNLFNVFMEAPLVGGAATATNAWALGLSGGLRVDASNVFISNSSSDTPTANTRLDVRGISGGTNIFRSATSGNTTIFRLTDTNIVDEIGTLVGTQTTQNLYNTTATTVNFAGAATTITIGGTPTTALNVTLFGNATATATNKAISIGTGGANGSNTSIALGPVQTGTAASSILLRGTVTVDATNNNLLITGNQLQFQYTNTSAGSNNIYASPGISGLTTGALLTIRGGNGFGTGATIGGDVQIGSGNPNGGGAEGSVILQTQPLGKIGIFNTSGVVQQSVNTILVNNVTSGGTLSTIANYTDLTTYSNDAAAIRNNFFRLTEKVLQLETALRNYGWVKN
jgi:hypothetical protein